MAAGIAAAYAAMCATIGDPVAHSEADRAFHAAIFEATHNFILARLIDVIVIGIYGNAVNDTERVVAGQAMSLPYHAAVLAAIELGKPVLVEKPIALTTADADRIIAASQKAGVEVRVGYSRRYKDRYLLAKEQIVQGRIGTVIGAAMRVYNSRSQALAMLGRNPHATPVVDALTYYVDLANWLLDGGSPVEVYARGQKGVLQAAGHEVDDVNWAILTYASGAVVNLGVCYALPEKYPSLGHAARVEILGSEGVMILDDDHTDQIMYSEKGVPHVYLPDHNVNMVFMGSGTPGEWALGDFWGPIANETRAWLDHLATGKPCVLATPQEARANLETTLAIELAADSGRQVKLPLSA